MRKSLCAGGLDDVPKAKQAGMREREAPRKQERRDKAKEDGRRDVMDRLWCKEKKYQCRERKA